MKRLPDAAAAHPTNVSLITNQLVSTPSHTSLHFPPGHLFHTQRNSSTEMSLFPAFDPFTGSSGI